MSIVKIKSVSLFLDMITNDDQTKAEVFYSTKPAGVDVGSGFPYKLFKFAYIGDKATYLYSTSCEKTKCDEVLQPFISHEGLSLKNISKVYVDSDGALNLEDFE